MANFEQIAPHVQLLTWIPQESDPDLHEKVRLIANVLAKVAYPDCRFVVKDWNYDAIARKLEENIHWVDEHRETGEVYRVAAKPSVEIIFSRPCAYTGSVAEFSSMVTLGRNITEEQVLDRILKSIILFEAHEVRERFKYKGRRIYNPHKTDSADEDKIAKMMTSMHFPVVNKGK